MRRALHRRYGHSAALRLWKLNVRTGLWDYQRTVTPETSARWLAIFQRDEPDATFVVSKNRPTPPALKNSKKYGHALPLVLVPVVKAGGVALTKLKSLGLAERAIEPVVKLGKDTWGWVAGRKKRRHSRRSS